MLDKETIALIAMSIMLLCTAFILVRYIKSRQMARVWFVGGVTLLMAAAWVMQLIKMCR